MLHRGYGDGINILAKAVLAGVREQGRGWWMGEVWLKIWTMMMTSMRAHSMRRRFQEGRRRVSI